MNHHDVVIPKEIRKSVTDSARWLAAYYPMMNCPVFCIVMAKTFKLPSMTFRLLWTALFPMSNLQPVWMVTPEDYADWFNGYVAGSKKDFVHAAEALFQIDPETSAIIWTAVEGRSINANGK